MVPVIENLSTLASALGGIEALRKLIREVAMRGQLLPQSHHDDAAPQVYPSVNGPFTIPPTWRWVALGAALEMVNGRAFKPSDWKTSGLPIVRIQNLNRETAEFNYADPDAVLPRHIIDSGTLLISWSGTPGTSFGAFIWNRGKAALNQHIFSCVQRSPAFSDRFLQLAINTRLDELIAKAHGGVGLQHVTKGKLEALALALPPLAEQHRIVAKVDELMALCDRLEARQQDAEAAHARLVQALLDSLTQARDAQEFQAGWERLAGEFETLFITESSIDGLKQAILQSACNGGMTAKPKSISVDDEPFDLPADWCWKNLGSLSKLVTSGSRGWKEFYSDKGSTFIRSQDIKADRLEFDQRAFVSLPPNTEGARTQVQKYDLLITITGANVGKAAVLTEPIEDAYVSQHVALVRLHDPLHALYIHRWLTNNYGGRRLLLSSSYGAKPGLNLQNIKDLPVPLPPLAEQGRIVAKVTELLALCDQLKARIAAGRVKQAQLAEALVKQAVAAAG